MWMYIWEATMKRSGPNDVFRVVWAISKIFSTLFVFFINTNHLTGILNLRMYLREATTTRTGPNDAKRIVWAISKCFYIIIRVFYIY